jgi:hypothetical protein
MYLSVYVASDEMWNEKYKWKTGMITETEVLLVPVNLMSRYFLGRTEANQKSD